MIKVYFYFLFRDRSECVQVAPRLGWRLLKGEASSSRPHGSPGGVETVDKVAFDERVAEQIHGIAARIADGNI